MNDNKHRSLQDCHTCKVRRIHCDRTLPGCFKCSKRNLQCPGYQPKLRWSNAIAVRGRFKGRSAPIEAAEKSSVATPSAPGNHVGAMKHLGCLLPDNASVSHLLDYYSMNLASKCVWIDSEENGYRRLVIPLAREKPALLLAITAVSAAYMSFFLTSDSDTQTNFSRSAAESAIRILTQEIRLITSGADGGQLSRKELKTKDAEAMLAAMLVLYNYSLIDAAQADASNHTGAARTIIKTLMLQEPRHSKLFSFLTNQMALFDVLACTTISDPRQLEEATLPDSQSSDVLFCDYLNLIHKVTRWGSRLDDPALAPSLLELEYDFQVARGQTLIIGGRAMPWNGREHELQLIMLADAFHHAGLLYTFARLHPPENRISIDFHTNRLVDILERTKPDNPILCKLAWPAFIAGTACHADSHGFGIIQKFYKCIVTLSGYRYYEHVESFLSELWKHPEVDWIKLAFEWERNGHPVVAI